MRMKRDDNRSRIGPLCNLPQCREHLLMPAVNTVENADCGGGFGDSVTAEVAQTFRPDDSVPVHSFSFELNIIR